MQSVRSAESYWCWTTQSRIVFLVLDDQYSEVWESGVVEPSNGFTEYGVLEFIPSLAVINPSLTLQSGVKEKQKLTWL